MPKAGSATIITIGDEIVTGKIIDGNSAYMARFLFRHGYNITSIISVGDDTAKIVAAWKQALKESAIVLCTGGLGPTHDDITREATKKIWKGGRKHSKKVDKAVRSYFKKRGRKMPPVCKGYADVPAEAECFVNPVGLAPALLFEKRLLLMPGIPAEMRGILQKYGKKILPHGGSHMAEQNYHADVGESTLMDKLHNLPLIRELADLAFLPHFGRVELRLIARGSSKRQAASKLKRAEKLMMANLAEHIWGRDEQSIAMVIGKLLTKKGETLAVAESCTGGGIGEAVTAVAGSSGYFLGGIIAYSNHVKQQMLNVKQKTLETYGAVSPETARGMADGVRKKFRTTYGLSATGIAGPDGGTAEKPLGLIYISLAIKEGTITKKLMLGEDRNDNRSRTVFAALKLLYKQLTGKQEEPLAEEPKQWQVYLVKCVDGSLYCGMAKDPKKREAEHNKGSKGARYTRSKRPVKLVGVSRKMTRYEAAQAEIAIKKTATAKKLAKLKQL